MPLLRQHPRRTNGCSIYYVGLGELAVEVSFPDALDSEEPSDRWTSTAACSPKKFSSSRAVSSSTKPERSRAVSLLTSFGTCDPMPGEG